MSWGQNNDLFSRVANKTRVSAQKTSATLNTIKTDPEYTRDTKKGHLELFCVQNGYDGVTGDPKNWSEITLGVTFKPVPHRR